MRPDLRGDADLDDDKVQLAGGVFRQRDGEKEGGQLAVFSSTVDDETGAK